MIKGLNNSQQSFTQRMLERNQLLLNKSMQKLASGKQINNASDNAAGLAILSKLTSQVSGEQQAALNVQDSYSVAQVAEGAYQTATDIQQRLRQLSVQSANGTLTDEDRAMLQEEADQLVSELDRMADTVEFNGQKILNGDYATGVEDFETQAGADAGETLSINFESLDAATLGLDKLDISTQAAAEQSIQKLDTSLNQTTQQQSQIGAYQNRLEKTFNFLGIQEENQMAAMSRIGDTDYAQEMINQTRMQLLSDVNISMLAQGNLLSNNVLGLIQ